MAIKALFVSLITSIIAVGCVAFPDEGYDARGYGQPIYRDYGYDSRYDRNNDRQRWERERAYRIQQMRIEQERRQAQHDRQRWQYEQAKRDQMRKQHWEQRRQEWNNKSNHDRRWDNRTDQKQWQQHDRQNQRDKKRDDRRGRDNNKD
jgi:hypothetical protein